MATQAHVVLTGEHLDLTWQVEVTGGPTELVSMLRVRRRGEPVMMSGFGGPALYPGELVNEWRGREDDSPYFVMARADVDVLAIVAQDHTGADVPLTSSDVVVAGVRHHACGLAVGREPALLRVLTRSRGWLDLPTPVGP